MAAMVTPRLKEMENDIVLMDLEGIPLNEVRQI